MESDREPLSSCFVVQSDVAPLSNRKFVTFFRTVLSAIVAKGVLSVRVPRKCASSRLSDVFSPAIARDGSLGFVEGIGGYTAEFCVRERFYCVALRAFIFNFRSAI